MPSISSVTYQVMVLLCECRDGQFYKTEGANWESGQIIIIYELYSNF